MDSIRWEHLQWFPDKLLITIREDSPHFKQLRLKKYVTSFPISQIWNTSTYILLLSKAMNSSRSPSCSNISSSRYARGTFAESLWPINISTANFYYKWINLVAKFSVFFFMIFFLKVRAITISIRECIRFRYHCLKLNKITQNLENISVIHQ